MIEAIVFLFLWVLALFGGYKFLFKLVSVNYDLIYFDYDISDLMLLIYRLLYAPNRQAEISLIFAFLYPANH